MKLVTIKNTLVGVLDLAPVKDSLGAVIALRGNEERDITEEQLGHPVIQRVKDAGWLVVVDKSAKAPASIPVIKTSAPPEELKLPEMPAEPPAEAPPAAPVEQIDPHATATAPVATSEMTEPPRQVPVETTVTSETPISTFATSEPEKEQQMSASTRPNKSTKNPK